MTQPTHTHITHGGRYAELAQHQGTGPLAGQWLVIYLDVDKGVQSVTTQDDWLAGWREIERDDCPVCLGAGHDQIKGNKDKPCGGCYGLGKVLTDGNSPTDLWGLAGVATGIIQRQQQELTERRRAMEQPEVRSALAACKHQHQERIENSIAEQEQEWRNGKGRGHGGRRHTGD